MATTKNNPNPPEQLDANELQAQVVALMGAVKEMQANSAASADNMRKMQEVIDEQNKKLSFYAGRAKQEEWENKKGAKAGNPIVKLRNYKGKIVVGWSNMKENWAKKLNGIWKENLRTTVYLNDGTSEEVDYAEFSTDYVMIDAEVIRRSEEPAVAEGEMPDVTFTCKTKDDIEVVINSRFVN